jgi:hypothetical protein
MLPWFGHCLPPDAARKARMVASGKLPILGARSRKLTAPFSRVRTSGPGQYIRCGVRWPARPCSGRWRELAAALPERAGPLEDALAGAGCSGVAGARPAFCAEIGSRRLRDRPMKGFGRRNLSGALPS